MALTEIFVSLSVTGKVAEDRRMSNVVSFLTRAIRIIKQTIGWRVLEQC